MSDAALLTRPTVDRAFERLYRNHVHDVYRYVLAVLRNPADAEDATQATFLNAYRAFQRGDTPELPRNWLLKIAHNECRQRFRMLSRRPKEVVWDERVAAPPVDETIPTADEIRQALTQLSFNQRSALVMRELEGRSYSEIAEILDLSGSAVETLLFRARRALREQLEGGLTCGDAEAALSKRLDGSLTGSEQSALRAHLRECRECSALERKQRAQRAALKRLGAVQLPPSLTGFFGGGGGTATGLVAGSGVAAKAAAIIAAGVVAGGVGNEAVDAIAAAEPAREPLPALKRIPEAFPNLLGSTSTPTVFDTTAQTAGKEIAKVTAGPSPAHLRGAVRRALLRPRRAQGSSPATAPSVEPAAPAATPQAPTPPAPVQGVVESAKEVVKSASPVEVPKVEVPKVEVPPAPPVNPPAAPPLPPLPPPPPLPKIGG